MIPYQNDLNKAAVILKKTGGLTPEKLLEKLEGSEYISVDLNEDETKVVVELDETKLDTEATEDSDNLITSGAVYDAVAGVQIPVESVNGETGAVVLSASDILATNTQSVQANLERIDTEVEGVIDDVADLETEVSGKSTVSVSATGTATDEIGYITVDGVEKKIAGGGSGEYLPLSGGTLTGSVYMRKSGDKAISLFESTYPVAGLEYVSSNGIMRFTTDGNAGSYVEVGTTGIKLKGSPTHNIVIPVSDNATKLGDTDRKWSTVYSNNLSDGTTTKTVTDLVSSTSLWATFDSTTGTLNLSTTAPTE